MVLRDQGDTSRTILLSEADIKGQGTFAMKDKDAGAEKTIKLDIIEASTAFNNLTGGSGEQLNTRTGSGPNQRSKSLLMIRGSQTRSAGEKIKR